MKSKPQLDPAEEVELAELEKYINKEQRIAAGHELGVTDDRATKRGTIKRAINRDLKCLREMQLSGGKAKARDDFVDHIRHRLMQRFASSFSYEPELGMDWG